jgi:hypothetical protein
MNPDRLEGPVPILHRAVIQDTYPFQRLLTTLTV